MCNNKSVPQIIAPIKPTKSLAKTHKKPPANKPNINIINIPFMLLQVLP